MLPSCSTTLIIESCLVFEFRGTYYSPVSFRCLFFGDVCSGKDPKVYLNSIFSLYDHFHSEYYQSTELDYPTKPMLPLVINTSGWVKGMFLVLALLTLLLL